MSLSMCVLTVQGTSHEEVEAVLSVLSQIHTGIADEEDISDQDQVITVVPVITILYGHVSKLYPQRLNCYTVFIFTLWKMHLSQWGCWKHSFA